MGLFGLFGKKKKEEAADDDEEEEKKEGADLGDIGAQITKINAQLDSFKEGRKSTQERFSTMNEQIGELRGQLMDTNKLMGALEVKVTKAADLVESVRPDKLMIQMQKADGKIEGLRGMIEAKDEMLKNVLDQIRSIRNQMNLFQGVEQILKLSEEVKEEIMSVKKLIAVAERHADRVENVFIETQKTFQDFNTFGASLESLKSEVKELGGKLDKLDIKTNTFMKKEDIEKRLNVVEVDRKHMKKLLEDIEESYKRLNKDFEQLAGELKGEFDRRLKKAEVLSKAFEDLLIQNPLFARGLNLAEYIQKAVEEKAKEELEGGPKAQEGGSEGGEGEGEEGGEESEGEEKKE